MKELAKTENKDAYHFYGQGQGVAHHQLTEYAVLNVLRGAAAEDAVCAEGVHVERTVLLDQLGSLR
jgi:hypothetical protein